MWPRYYRVTETLKVVSIRVKTNWLASPPLVVAYGLVGTIRKDLTAEPLGQGKNGEDIYLKDIWPSSAEIAAVLQKVDTEMFHKEYADVFEGDESWQSIQIPHSKTYEWADDSTYIQHPPFLKKSISHLSRFRILSMHVFWPC